MSDPSLPFSSGVTEQLQAEADRYVVRRATPGIVIAPAVMLMFTLATGTSSPFSRASVSLTVIGLGLMIPRAWLTTRLRGPAASRLRRGWHRAYVALLVASYVVFAAFTAVGVARVASELTAAAMVFACMTLLAGTVHVFAPRRRLSTAIVLILYLLPLPSISVAPLEERALFLTLTTIQLAYALMLGKRLHADYWELATARARLGERNRDMRIVLDNVGQAFVTIDESGVLARERSATVDRWFGEYDDRPRFVDYIAKVDPAFAEEFALAHEALVDGLLPREVCLAQLPSRLRRDAREYRCTYLPLPATRAREGALLIVVDDVTESLQHAQDEVMQKELLAVAQGLVTDRSAHLAFIDEGEQLVQDLRLTAEPVALARALHTLKGNAAMVGAHGLAAQCHRAEEEIDASGELSEETLRAVRAHWQAITRATTAIVGTRTAGSIEVAPESIDALVESVLAGAQASAVVARLTGWKLEPAERALARLASHAASLALRLGKGEIVAHVSAPDVRVDKARWTTLSAILVHVVRNAVDHGIESPEAREAGGKSTPRLDLRARVDGPSLFVTIADDGRGIDWDVVRERASAQGLPAATSGELEAALLHPGFTTRREATSVSGRGIGMAAVAREVRELGGSLHVTTQPGRGTTWHVRVPLAQSPQSGRREMARSVAAHSFGGNIESTQLHAVSAWPSVPAGIPAAGL